MGLFDSVRGALGGSGDDEPELTDDVPRPADHGEPTPTDFRNKAVDAVQEWDVSHLDFTLESLPHLDTFADRQGARLDVMHADGDDDAAVAQLHTAFSIRAGSYFGEVLVREAGGDWVERGDAWAVQLPTGDDATIVDVFEVAAHSFAETPLFAETARELGIDVGVDDAAEEPDEPETDDVRPEMRETAESVADTWDAYALDFSPASVVRLDDLVEREFDPYEFDGVDVGGDDMAAKMYRERLKQLGSYFGEVLVRQLDAEWNRRGGEVVVDVPAGRDGWVTVPVFDVAGEGLRGAPRFVLEYNRCITDAGLDVNEVDPSEPATDADHDTTLDADPPEADSLADQPEADPQTEGGTPAEPAGDRTAETGASAPPDHRADAVDGDHPAAPDRSTDTGGDGAPDTGTRPADGPADDDAVAAAADALGEPEKAPGGASRDADETDHPAGGRDDAADADPADQTPGADPDPDPDPVAAGETLDLGDGGGGRDPLTAADVTEDATQFAATWPGYDLDFTPKSLERLDRLVREEYETDDVPAVALDGTGVDDSYLTARLVETGGYFAEVVRRSVGGEWREDDGLTFVVEGRRAETRLDPVAIAADCFRGEESFAAAYADVRDAVGTSAGSGGR